jgi:aminocarboxymuconate-semialdehyde decarboxylase
LKQVAVVPETELIDVHTHVVPESFPAYLGKHANAPWPSMAPAHTCHRHMMISGSVYRTVSHQCWDCAVRTADMDARRVGRQVLSPMPELLSYWMEPEDGAAMCRYLNDVIATMVASAPTRFFGLGAVPLQDVPLAIRELERAVKEMGLSGVEIAGSVNGRVIGDPMFLPFFEAAAKWGAAVFVHPLRPTGMERLVGPPMLEQVLAFPGETGLAAASLITGGTMARVPDLRIAFSHGGGTLAALLPRLQQGWKTFPALADSVPQSPAEQARRLFYDTLVYDAPTLRHLVACFGAQALMLGTDYPFNFHEPRPVGRLDEAGLDAATRDALAFGNARRFLGRAAPVPDKETA